MLMGILLRLPAKSLVRFKSVCKRWRSLISSDYYCHQHTLRRPKLQQSLILHYMTSWWDVDYFYWNPASINGENVKIPYTLSVSPDHDYKILQACNGLLLLRGQNNDDYRVYNPTTRLSTEINIPSYKDEEECVEAMAIAFDPSESPHYKIVCIIHCSSNRDNDTYRVEVYDSKSRSWKPTLSPSRFYFIGSVFEAQYCNNAIFWWESCHDICCCFDIAKNEMKELELPPPYRQDLDVEFDTYLQELDGNLYYLRFSFQSVLDSETLKLWAAVWEMGGDDESEWRARYL